MTQASLTADLARLVEGTVSDDPAVLAAAGSDYGGLYRKEPAVVVRPASAAGAARAVAYAYARDLPISARAGGYSFAGQSLNQGGLVLDLRELHGFGPLDAAAGTFEAQAATPWKTIVAATTRAGWVPPVTTSYLGTSLGGTLSAAGFGMSSAFHGTQVEQCEELEIVHHSGELLRCSAEQNAELFSHALCGFGQFGVITRARQRLRRAARRVRTYFLLYDDLGAHLADQRKLVEEKRVAYLDGMVQPCHHGLKMTAEGGRTQLVSYLYPLNLTAEIPEGGEPDDAAVLAGLDFSKWVYAEDSSLADFLLVGHGDDQLPNPRIADVFVDVLVPWPAVEAFMAKVEAHIYPLIVHVDHTILWPMTRHTLTRPLLKTPDEEMFMGIGLYSRVPRSAAQATLKASQAFVELAIRMGGTYYLSGSMRFDAAHYEHQFGAEWPAVREVKRRYDPKGLFNPGFFQWAD
jgi:cytokinin dehydrogenase